MTDQPRDRASRARATRGRTGGGGGRPDDPFGNASPESSVPGAPTGYGRGDGPSLPHGIPEPGDLPALDDLVEPSEINDTEIYVGELEAKGAEADPGRFEDPLLGLEIRDDETTDPIEAIEEGLPYVPPIDPVIAGTGPGGDPIIASGFAASALDEPYDASHHGTYALDEGEVTARVRDALRADAQTTGYAEAVEIAVLGAEVTIRGVVEDVEDADAIVAVAERVAGVRAVVDELEVASLEAGGRDPRGRDEA